MSLISKLTSAEENDFPGDAVEEIRRDSSTPLTSEVICRLLDPQKVEPLAEVVLPHLCLDARNRLILQQALEVIEAEPEHPAYALLAEAEEWTRWAKAGQDAATTATQRLMAQGIGYVYGRNGGVYRRLPGGSEETILVASGD